MLCFDRVLEVPAISIVFATCLDVTCTAKCRWQKCGRAMKAQSSVAQNKPKAKDGLGGVKSKAWGGGGGAA